jgi:hypothetical protein
MTLHLSLVIPAFNEANRLDESMGRLSQVVDTGTIDAASTEFVVVDDGSTDGTVERAASLLSRYPHVRVIGLPENRGKGAAVRAGVASATGRHIVFADADMAIEPDQTPQFLAALSTSDLAIASRQASGSSVDRPSLGRSAMNRGFNLLVRSLTRVPLADTQCGYKAFRAPVAKLLFHCSVTQRFAFDVEILSLAHRLGFSISEVPVRWRRVEGSRVRPLTDVTSMARDVVRAGRGAAVVDAGLGVPALWITSPVGHPEPGVQPWALDMATQCPTLPILARPAGQVVVLCPFTTPEGVSAIATLVRSLTTHVQGEVGIEQVTLSLPEIRGLAPLRLIATT